MKNLRTVVFYITVLMACGLFIYLAVQQGSQLESGRDIIVANSQNGAWGDFIESLKHGLQHPLAVLLLQIIAIILTARAFGWICIKIKQPVVIGEMLAGIALGPSLLGLYFPETFTVLFPTESLGNLQFLSQMGLILFMFIIGMELDLDILKNKAQEAITISHVSIILPFSLGVVLAYFLYDSYAPENTPFLSYGLFIGVAMSIAAFPVMARIIQERGLQKTKMGSIAITCAAIDDITGWCLLAAVIAIVKAGSFVSALYTIALALAYVVFMIKIVRPFIHRMGNLNTTKESLSKRVVAVFFLLLLFSSYAAEIIGIHALFGAFMAGAVMPENNKFRNVFIEKIEDVALVLLLPLFFVFTGLRTQIGLLNDPTLWMITGIIILVAIAGKFGGSVLASKFLGQNWKDSLGIGVLMNTRGLMELVILNIGYDLGVLSAELFSMMVVMALVTTFMTGPTLNIINWAFRGKETPKFVEDVTAQFKILFSFGKVESGKALLRLSSALANNPPQPATVSALHIAPANEIHHFEIEEAEDTYFKEIISDGKTLSLPINPIFKISSDIDNEIVQEVREGEYDLLLIGTSESIYEGSLLGKIIGFTSNIINTDKLFTHKRAVHSNKFYERTNRLLSKIDIPVGILIDKGFGDIQQIVVPVFFKEDLFLMNYVNKITANNNIQVTLWDVDNRLSGDVVFGSLSEGIDGLGDRLSVLTNDSIDTNGSAQDRLIIISLVSWQLLLEQKRKLPIDISSVLVIRDRIVH